MFNPAIQFCFADKIVVVWRDVKESRYCMRIHDRSPVYGSSVQLADKISEALTGWGRDHPSYIELVENIRLLG